MKITPQRLETLDRTAFTVGPQLPPFRPALRPVPYGVRGLRSYTPHLGALLELDELASAGAVCAGRLDLEQLENLQTRAHILHERVTSCPQFGLAFLACCMSLGFQIAHVKRLTDK